MNAARFDMALLLDGGDSICKSMARIGRAAVNSSATAARLHLLTLGRRTALIARSATAERPCSRFGQVAQLVEQGIENPRVGGSIPSLATIFPKPAPCAGFFVSRLQKARP
jgi:hypothetical protein